MRDQILNIIAICLHRLAREYKTDWKIKKWARNVFRKQVNANAAATDRCDTAKFQIAAMQMSRTVDTTEGSEIPRRTSFLCDSNCARL